MNGASSGPGVVLLVDPTGSLVDRLGDELDEAGFEFASVASATECVAFVEGQRPLGIVSRFDLPVMDGIRLLRSMRVSYPALPFLLAPREGSESIAAEAIAAAASGYLPTDVEAATAVDRLRDAIDLETRWSGLEGERRYRNLVEISPAPINLFDESGESIWGNDAVLDLLGLPSRADLVGRPIFDFIHPDDHETARRELETVTEGKESVGPTNMRLRRPDGEIRHIQVSTAIGSFLGADIGQAVVVDVSELRSAQQALKAERDFIAETLDTLQDIFYVVDLDGNLLQWNQTANDVAGYTDDELQSMTLDEFFDEETVEQVRDSMAKVIEEGNDTVEVSLRTKGGELIPYEFRGRLLRDEEGETRVVGIGRDISDRKTRDRQLRVLDQWLRHNIRNDINIIQGIASDITGYASGDVEANAEKIWAHASDLVEQADRERKVVDILTSPPDRRVVDLVALVERAIETVLSRHPNASVQLGQADAAAAFAIPAVGEAVAELLENAIRHQRTDPPTVRVDVSTAPDGEVTVRVTDDGPGIPQSEIDVLDERSEIDQLNHNTGMGLMFVYSVVRASDGDISFESNEPTGSVVVLTLQAADST